MKRVKAVKIPVDLHFTLKRFNTIMREKTKINFTMGQTNQMFTDMANKKILSGDINLINVKRKNGGRRKSELKFKI